MRGIPEMPLQIHPPPRIPPKYAKIVFWAVFFWYARCIFSISWRGGNSDVRLVFRGPILGFGVSLLCSWIVGCQPLGFVVCVQLSRVWFTDTRARHCHCCSIVHELLLTSFLLALLPTTTLTMSPLRQLLCSST